VKDDEKVFAEVKRRATHSEHEKALTDLCQELLGEFESKSSKGVTSVIGAKMQALRSAYNDAHSALMKKMGLKLGGSR